eukprot:gnl/TRDRNA2_/TRDRNA2_132186_c0_seq1.p1 gnl/TRDRNA2_/TRDRNA2_132186_c0~~gnl/TRDRNA2_/TRDRNA2_132186_c0_seq1.p1  ORF type:complete len:278 (+),score=52.60 gnl/TRDRNA2_/TRDRNA2_132186_c0_seq1:124-834(+)
MFEEGQVDKNVSFPVGMWTTPEAGYYGLTLEAAQQKGLDVEEGISSYDHCLRGRVFAPDGMLKLVFSKKDGVILGVHVIGAEACEIVHFGMDLVDQGVTIFRVMTTVFVAVTFHELFKEAAVNGNSKLKFGLQWHRLLDEFAAELSKSAKDVGDEQILQLFESMDLNHDHSLEVDELCEVVQRLGLKMDRGTISNMVRLADKDGNGTMEWGEFSRICQACMKKNSTGQASSPNDQQ